jgi:hypothetical protein
MIDDRPAVFQVMTRAPLIRCQEPGPWTVAPALTHMNPGLRGRYRLQSPSSRSETSTIGKVIRMR